MERMRYEILKKGHGTSFDFVEDIDLNEEELAVYIAQINPEETFKIRDFMGFSVLVTVGCFIESCSDKELLNNLIPILMPYQLQAFDMF